MAKASPIQSAFNGGELSPLLDGRSDVDKYRVGCSVLENFIPTVQGPIVRRGGTRYIGEVKDSADQTWFIPFQYSPTSSYMIEVGSGYFRFYKARARLTATVAAYNAGTAYTPGKAVSNAGVNYVCIANTTGNAPPNATYWHPLTSDIYEIPTPYVVAGDFDLTGSDGQFTLKFAQTGDVIYIAHPLIPLQKLLRHADKEWELQQVELTGGPFQDVNIDAGLTMSANAETGSTVTFFSSDQFVLTDEGAQIYLERPDTDDTPQWEPGKAINAGDRRRSFGVVYEALNTATTGTIRPSHLEGAVYDGDTGVQWEYRDAGYGIIRMDTYNNVSIAVGTIQLRLPESVVAPGSTANWARDLFSETNGYPEHVCFFRNRLVLVKGQTLAFSVVEDYENFSRRDTAGLLTDDMGIVATISTDTASEVQWITPTSNGLLLGTSSGEMLCSELSQADVFSANNIRIETQTTFGSRSIQPVRYKDAAIFIQRSGRRVRQIGYSWDVNGFRSADLSSYNPTICAAGITDMAYQQEPWSTVWMVRSDGVLVGMTLDIDQQVTAFSRHIFGGSGIVEAIGTIPAPDNDRDDLYLIVRRTIDGNTVRYVEVLMPEHQTGDDQEDGIYLDCSKTYDGVATTTITGLDHLEGATVGVCVDGASHPNEVVASGQITLDVSSQVVHVGFAQTAKVRTMRIEAGAADGTAQGKTKRIHNVTLRFVESLGGKVGPDTSNLDEIQFRTASDPMDQSVPLFTGDKFMLFPSGYDSDGYIVYSNSQPFPVTLVAMMPQVVTQDRG